MKTVDPRDQRRSPRRGLRAPCGLLCRGKYALSQVHQISEGGALVETAHNLQVGDQLTLVVQIPGAAYFSARLRVVYQKSEGFFGMAFEDLPLKARRWIRTYVAAKTQKEADMDLPLSS